MGLADTSCVSFGFYTKVVAELLKLTMSAAYAGETFSVVVGENKLQCLFTRFQYLWSVGEYLHGITDTNMCVCK